MEEEDEQQKDDPECLLCRSPKNQDMFWCLFMYCYLIYVLKDTYVTLPGFLLQARAPEI